MKFIGESVDDCGGGFSESIAEMCDELQNGSLPLLISTPNSEEESDTPSDYFLINSDANEKQHKEMFRFFGKILKTYEVPPIHILRSIVVQCETVLTRFPENY